MYLTCGNIFEIKFCSPEDCINLSPELVNSSSCYFPYTNDVMGLFSILAL